VTALTLLRDEDLAEKANKTAAELRKALTEVLVKEGVPWGIYGQSSTFLIYPNPFNDPIDPATFDPLKVPFAKLKGARGAGPLTGKIRMGLMTHGVDVMGAPGGFVSATHGGAEIEKTVHALRQTVRALKAEREVKAA
jgi:glutamate-1-semialdehyde 2,1-aminomutase